MTDALSCDGPGCDQVAAAPFLGWWQLVNASLVQKLGDPGRMDFCSWACLGAFVLDQAGDVAEIERRIQDI